MRIANFAFVLALLPAACNSATNVKVQDYGAKCDGTTDDTDAIQKAIDAVANNGGGTVKLPGSTCLLNTAKPADHPWYFYNLMIHSKVTLEGVAGSRLLQGPNGRKDLASVPGASYMSNTVIAIGEHYSVVSFQQGPFYRLNDMTVGAKTIQIQTAGDEAHFKAGDYVAIYEYTSGDVLPGQMTQVTQVNGQTLTVADAVVRHLPTPWITNVTAKAAHDIGIRNVVIQGVLPINVLETWNLNVTNVQFISDTSIPGNIYTNVMNTMEHATFVNNLFKSINGAYIPHQELGQRDSQNGVWRGNTFHNSGVGFGEYAANMVMTGNHIFNYPDGSGIGDSIGGQNVVFSNNDIHVMGNFTGASGWGFVLADVYGCCGYTNYTGNISITNNTIDCAADGNSCIMNVGIASTISGNTINETGNWAQGIYSYDSRAIINKNTINLKANNGIVLTSYGYDAATVSNNKVNLSGSCCTGILVQSATGGTPSTGGHQIKDNTIKGFTTPIYVDKNMHPGTIVTGNN